MMQSDKRIWFKLKKEQYVIWSRRRKAIGFTTDSKMALAMAKMYLDRMAGRQVADMPDDDAAELDEMFARLGDYEPRPGGQAPPKQTRRRVADG